MSDRLDPTILAQLIECENIDGLSLDQIAELVRREESLSRFIPDGVCRTDPRNGDRILYNSARARRPHDNQAPKQGSISKDEGHCVICRGKTTGVIDVAKLSEGFTFINKNLYPILFPQNLTGGPSPGTKQLRTNGGSATGVHLLQWTSSVHDRDWQNLPQGDRFVVMQRLAALEQRLLSKPEPNEPESRDRTDASGFVSIIKNYGPLVGGSLDHGHQQIALSNVMPRRFQDNLRFQERHGEPFTSFILRENPNELLVRDYGSTALIVPYFMRRPYDLLLVVKDASKCYLHELSRREIRDVADGWHDSIRAVLLIMARMGRGGVYNVIANNGPAQGVYFDILPYTQEMGGMEQLGLYVCEQDPIAAAALLREAVEEDSRDA
jgi:galactose-1-phosphate uridylyltransferase